MVYDPVSSRLYVMEHGPRGGDEINVIEKGANYGWPVITYGKEYWGPSIGEGSAKAGLQQPIKYYVPSIAPCDLMLYSGKAFPNWKGSLFAGALKGEHLNRVEMKEGKAVGEERLLVDQETRIRSVEESPEGFIYVGTDGGEIWRLVK
jgi:glucose/arabinose dehydrogenase